MKYLLKLKTYGAALLAFLLAVVTAGYYRQKSKRETERRQNAEKAAEVQHKATKAIIEGQKREKSIRKKRVDTLNPRHFQ